MINIKHQINPIPNFLGYYADTKGNIWSKQNIRNQKTKLNNIEIKNIKILLNNNNLTQQKIANIFSTNKEAISRINRNEYLKSTTKRLKPYPNNKGYLYVNLYNKDTKPIKMMVHQAILFAFIGPRPINMEACHNDGDPTNNKLENLRWDTKKNNMKDKIRHGKTKCSNKTRKSLSKIMRGKNAKLNEQQVRVIKAFKKLQNRPTYQEIADFFNISSGHVSDILHNKKWIYL